MKKIMLYILFVLCITMSSCMKDNRQIAPYETRTEQKETTLSNVDSTKQETAVTKDSVKGEVAKNEPKVIVQTQVIPQSDNAPSMWDLIAIGLSCFSLVLCIILWYLMAGLEREISHDMSEIGYDIGHKQSVANRHTLDRLKQLENNYANVHIDLGKFAERLLDIEAKLKNASASSEKEKAEITRVKQLPKRMGYFGIVKSGNGISMFNDYPQSRNEGAFFEVEYYDEEHCEFSPIDLDRIRSIDAVGEAVEYNGNMAYAKSLKVKKKGKAVLDKEHGFWRITDKAKIELKN